jgi:spermidine/putrescine transport system substrate-binding protein
MKKFRLLLPALVLAALLTGCKKANNDQVLYVYNWTYYTPQKILDEFKKETGITVVVDNFASNEEMFAKVMAHGDIGYDILFPSADYTSIMMKLEMLSKIDHGDIPNLKYISPLVREKATYDPDMEYSVPYFMGSSGIAVNKEKVTDYERDWSIFADKRLKGKMTLLDDMREVVGAALIYLGYDANSTDEEELEAAKNLIIKEWKPNIVKFDSESFGKSFSRGEFTVVHCYAENIFEEMPESKWKDIDFFIPEEGGMMYIDNMVVPKNAPHKKNAWKFINFICDPKIYAQFLDEFHFPSTTNTDAGKYTTTQSYFKAEDLKNSKIIIDLGEDLDMYNRIWQEIRYEH